MKRKLKLIVAILAMLLLCSCSDVEKEKLSQEKTDQKTEQQEMTNQDQQQETTSQILEQQETTSKESEQPTSAEEGTKPEEDKKEPIYNDNVTDKLVIKLHYHRSDNNYDDWSVWGWEEGCDGTDYPLVKENGEMVATIEVSTGVESFGYIVRTPEWDKDVVSDQYIDCSSYVTGTLHVFVESGIEGHTVQEGKDIVKGQGGNNKLEKPTSGNQSSKPDNNDNVPDKLVIKLHYHRSDNNYVDWSVWGWDDGCMGAEYPLVEENGEMVATMEVTAGVDKFGYIVKTSEWEKDIDVDQYIDCSSYVAGTLHIFIESGIEGYTVQEGNDIVKKRNR